MKCAFVSTLLSGLFIGAKVLAETESLTCQFELAKVPVLTDEQRQAIRVAADSRYSIDLVSKVIKGIPRVIVLVGEGHIKDSDERLALIPLIKAVRHRAVEAANLSGYWFSKRLDDLTNQLVTSHTSKNPDSTY